MHEVRPALVMHRRRRQTGFDQFDSPAIDHLVFGGSRYRDGPAEVVGNADAHAVDYGWDFTTPVRQSPASAACSHPGTVQWRPSAEHVGRPAPPEINAGQPTSTQGSVGKLGMLGTDTLGCSG